MSKAKERREESDVGQTGISTVVMPEHKAELKHSFATISSVDGSTDCSTSISTSKVEGIDYTLLPHQKCSWD